MAGENLTKLKIDNVVKEYVGNKGKTVALNGVSLDIKENEFICVVGPSGCGKSTLLNIIAGLLEPTSGAVYLDGKKIEGTGVERGVVFQGYALFPWRTVLKNVMFGLEMKRMPKDQAEKIAKKYIRAVGLEGFEHAYPKELSGAPSLILRYWGKQESAWEVAKRYNTTIPDILAANQIERESEIPCEKLLLIPKKRA